MRARFFLSGLCLLPLSFGCDSDPESLPPEMDCSAGETRAGSTVCGLNDEGVLQEVCTDGVWRDDLSLCSGNHICVNDRVEAEACGERGTQERTCAEGQWGDWGDCVIVGCTDPEASNFDAEAMTDDGSCRYPPSSVAFLEYAQPEFIPGRFPLSACDGIEQHHQCVSTEGCNWLRTLKNNGVCRQDPVSRCLASGECVCRASDFHGEPAHNGDLELFVPLSITWTNLAPRTSAFGGHAPQYTTHIDMAEIVNESLENFTSRTDFTYKTLSVRSTPDADLDALGRSGGLSLTLKFMRAWDKIPGEISGVLLSGLGMQVELDADRLSVVVDGTSHPIRGEHAGRVKDYQCNQLAIVIPPRGDAQVYLGDGVTAVPGLDMAAVQASLSDLGAGSDILQVGAVNAKVWDLRVYGEGRQLSARDVATIGRRCGNAGDYPIPSGYEDSNRRYSWGMGGYAIVPGHATQSYSSGVYVTMRIPEADTFPPTDTVFRDNLNRMIGFWDRWQEQMFFELDLIPFVDRRQLMPEGSKNTYRDFSEADNLGEGVTGSREPANYNNPCRYVTDLFQGFNWLPEDFPGEPTSADHRKVAERGGWTRWDSYDPETYGSWQRPVHEHGHTGHFTLMRTYRKVHHYIRGIAGESFAEVMSNYLLVGMRVWMTQGLTYYPSIPLAFEGRWDRRLERHVFKSSQPYQEKNIDDLGLGARFYGLGAWWFYVSHYAAKPYLIGMISGDTDETPGTTIQKTRFYLAQEGLDFGELFGDYAAHMATWDWPYSGHQFYAQDQEPFSGIENWCTENSGPNCSIDSLKTQADVDAATGTSGEWVDGPEGLAPGGFAFNTIRIKNAEGGALYAFELEFEVPSQLYRHFGLGDDYHIRLTPKCKNDPRFFSSRIVVSEVEAAPKAQRENRPHYYKIPGRKVESVIVQVPEGQTSDIYLLPIPTPPFELEDVYPFVQGFSLVWPYRYKITKLDRLPEGAQVTAPIVLNGDEMLSLTPQEGAGFTYDCFAP